MSGEKGWWEAEGSFAADSSEQRKAPAADSYSPGVLSEAEINELVELRLMVDEIFENEPEVKASLLERLFPWIVLLLIFWWVMSGFSNLHGVTN